MKKRYLPYEEKYLYFSKSIELLLKKLIVILVVILMISQLLMMNSYFRYWFVPVEKMEGTHTD